MMACIACNRPAASCKVSSTRARVSDVLIERAIQQAECAYLCMSWSSAATATGLTLFVTFDSSTASLSASSKAAWPRRLRSQGHAVVPKKAGCLLPGPAFPALPPPLPRALEAQTPLL